MRSNLYIFPFSSCISSGSRRDYFVFLECCWEKILCIVWWDTTETLLGHRPSDTNHTTAYFTEILHNNFTNCFLFISQLRDEERMRRQEEMRKLNDLQKANHAELQELVKVRNQ